jgi:hypothetical protein
MNRFWLRPGARIRSHRSKKGDRPQGLSPFFGLAEREGLFRTSLYSTASRPAQQAVLFKFVPDKFVEPPLSMSGDSNPVPQIKKGGQTSGSVPFFGLAEREGFEPPDPFGSTVFKTAAFDHSATSPEITMFQHVPTSIPGAGYRLVFPDSRSPNCVCPQDKRFRLTHSATSPVSDIRLQISDVCRQYSF